MTANQTILDRLTAALAGRYTIEREIGQGGMATVYLAQDVRHSRKVALKVLRPELSAILGAERFLHEIRTTANLQHPHILPLHDSGDADGLVFYVMPFVAGESLRSRLSRETQLPVEDAVCIAREVADALDYAHRHGVIHRDIKPENILLHDGRAQVADFGIALAVSTAGGGTRMTETGMSLGTPHYMSPEQAMGEREISGKADIYALGCVLYEMLVGEPPFTGPSAQAIIARVVTEEPRSLTLQRKSIPPQLEAVVRRALEKLPADRFQSAAQFSAALADPDSVPMSTQRSRGTIARAANARNWRSSALLVPVMGALLLLATATAAWSWFRPNERPVDRVVRFTLSFPETASYIDLFGRSIAMSPDGDRIVYTGVNKEGHRQLFLRSMDDVKPVAIAGTSGATQPFFAPDGLWIGFVAAGGKIQKVAVTGGVATTMATVDSGVFGAAWGSGDVIVVASRGGLLQFPASGGRPTVLTRPDTASERTLAHHFPTFLPDGRTVLFQATDSAGTDRLASVTLDGGVVKRFDVVGSDPRYVESGHVLVASRTGAIVAVPFDASRLEVTGPAFSVVDGVAMTTTLGVARLGVSRNGSMVYTTRSSGLRSLVLVDRKGVSQRLSDDMRPYASPRFSPDGRTIAVEIEDQRSSIWLFNLAQKMLTRLTFEGNRIRPVWAPDGSRLVSSVAGGGRIMWTRADGSTQSEPVPSPFGAINADDWSPDGRFLVVHHGSNLGPTKNDIAFLLMDSLPATRPYVGTPADEYSPAVSPDGRWLAFVSDETGQPEVYVRAFPKPEGKTQVSVFGGTEPRWSRNGRELFYRSARKIMVASMGTSPVVSVQQRTELFSGSFRSSQYFAQYDPSPDGRHLLMVHEPETSQDFVVVLNWFDQLRGKRGTTSQRNGGGQ